MITETLRMVEAVLIDVTLGVNAQIDALALDHPNGSVTPDTRPTHVTVRNAADHDPAIREAEETQFPLVVVDVMNPGIGAGQPFSGVRDEEIDLIIAYVVQSGDVAGNERAADYSLRAIVRSVTRGLLASGKRDTAGMRNGYVISKAAKLKYGPTKQPHSSGVMTGAVQFTVTVRDTQP